MNPKNPRTEQQIPHAAGEEPGDESVYALSLTPKERLQALQTFVAFAASANRGKTAL